MDRPKELDRLRTRQIDSDSVGAKVRLTSSHPTCEIHTKNSTDLSELCAQLVSPLS